LTALSLKGLKELLQDATELLLNVLMSWTSPQLREP